MTTIHKELDPRVDNSRDCHWADIQQYCQNNFSPCIIVSPIINSCVQILCVQIAFSEVPSTESSSPRKVS